jgi:vacuolar protein sorting-associated protein 13A/C
MFDESFFLLPQVTKGQKDFFDNLHLSPLKVHVSFSLTSYKSSKSASRRSNFFGLFLQSLGVTITDTDDIIFRLAYFERKHQGRHSPNYS